LVAGYIFLNEKSSRRTESFIPAAGAKLQGGPKRNIKLHPTQQIYKEQPKRSCGHAIWSKNSAGDELLPIGATPATTGDETTWLCGGHQCQSKTVVHPLAEEEIARETDDIERGEATPWPWIEAATAGHHLEYAVGS
jgi:hypothetical protein